MILLLLCTITAISAVPVLENAEEEISKIAMENPDLFGGDMLESIEDINDRNVIPQQRFRWPNGVVHYVIDKSLQPSKNVIEQAFSDYHSKTCIRFVLRTNQRDYINIFPGQGCYSRVGRVGGMQALSLGRGCAYKGIIIHELGHAVGFWHEQNRSDRDNYLDIFLENVHENMKSNFRKLLPQQNLLLTPFDYNSIMIYANDAFSKNGKATMKAKNGQKLLDAFRKPGLNASDVKRLKIMYNCK